MRIRKRDLFTVLVISLLPLLVSMAQAAAPNLTDISPAKGAAGQQVTITGSGFEASQGTSSVTFGSIQANPTNWSATSIVVPVPAGTTTCKVVVTVGGVPSNAITFTVASTLSARHLVFNALSREIASR